MRGSLTSAEAGADGETIIVAPLAMRLERTLEASSGERVRVCGANVVGCAARVTVTVTRSASASASGEGAEVDPADPPDADEVAGIGAGDSSDADEDVDVVGEVVAEVFSSSSSHSSSHSSSSSSSPSFLSGEEVGADLSAVNEDAAVGRVAVAEVALPSLLLTPSLAEVEFPPVAPRIPPVAPLASKADRAFFSLVHVTSYR